MERIESTVIRIWSSMKTSPGKVLPFVRSEYFENYSEKEVIFEEISKYSDLTNGRTFPGKSSLKADSG